MAEKKHSAFALLNILIRYSDEEHILTTRQIQQYMKDEYGLILERRTLYSNMDILEQGGYSISRYEDNGKGYYLEERQFDKAEILLLCNAIHASHFISSKQSDQLIKKLLNTLSAFEAKEFKDSVYMPNSQKTPNKELMYNVRAVSEAIRDRRTVSFTYLRYNKEKHLVPRRKEPYIVEPRYIVYADSRAYVIVTSLHHEGFIHYRLDRISNVRILDESAVPLHKDVDAYQYAKNKLFMFAGDMEAVTFRCHERIMDQMIDLVGTEIMVLPDDEEHFAIRIRTSATGAKFLAQQYLDSLEIVDPVSLREEFEEELEEALTRYKKG